MVNAVDCDTVVFPDKNPELLFQVVSVAKPEIGTDLKLPYTVCPN